MPNWCSNVVKFSGDKNQIKQVLKLFRQLARNGKKQMLGQLPEFVSKEQPHFFEICVEKDKIHFLTKWQPNNEALKEIADNFKIGFTSGFDDLPMGLFGDVKYQDNAMHVVFLDAFDFQSYHYDQKTNSYRFEGESYEFEWPIFDKLLNRKIALVECNELPVFMEQEEREALFKTTSRITGDELIARYGQMGEGDLLLRLAEYKNFDAARTLFQTWDEHSVIMMENFLIQGYRHEIENYKSRDKYLAVAFLNELIGEWTIKSRESEQRGRKSGR